MDGWTRRYERNRRSSHSRGTSAAATPTTASTAKNRGHYLPTRLPSAQPGDEQEEALGDRLTAEQTPHSPPHHGDVDERPPGHVPRERGTGQEQVNGHIRALTRHTPGTVPVSRSASRAATAGDHQNPDEAAERAGAGPCGRHTTPTSAAATSSHPTPEHRARRAPARTATAGISRTNAPGTAREVHPDPGYRRQHPARRRHGREPGGSRVRGSARPRSASAGPVDDDRDAGASAASPGWSTHRPAEHLHSPCARVLASPVVPLEGPGAGRASAGRRGRPSAAPDVWTAMTLCRSGATRVPCPPPRRRGRSRRRRRGSGRDPRRAHRSSRVSPLRPQQGELSTPPGPQLVAPGAGPQPTTPHAEDIHGHPVPDAQVPLRDGHRRLRARTSDVASSADGADATPGRGVQPSVPGVDDQHDRRLAERHRAPGGAAARGRASVGPCTFQSTWRAPSPGPGMRIRRPPPIPGRRESCWPVSPRMRAGSEAGGATTAPGSSSPTGPAVSPAADAWCFDPKV